LVIETPRANLAEAMKWLLDTYTCRFTGRPLYLLVPETARQDTFPTASERTTLNMEICATP